MGPELTRRGTRDSARNQPPRNRWAVLGHFAALALGLFGTWGTIRGWAPLVIHGPVQRAGLLWIGGLALAFTAVVALARDRVVVVVGAATGLMLGCLAATAPNVGREIGLIAAASIVLGRVAWFPPRREHGTGRSGVALVALPLLIAAQLTWATTARATPTLVLLAAAGVAIAGYQVFPDTIGSVDDRLRDQLVASVRRVAEMARRARAAGARGARRCLDAVRHARWFRDRAGTRLAIGVTTVAVLATQLPIFYRYSTESPATLGTSDFATHMFRATTISIVPFAPGTPYPMYHLSVYVLTPLLGAAWASTLVLGAATVLTVAVMVWFCTLPFGGRSPLGPRLGALFALGYYFAESPNVLAQAARVGNPFDWATTLHSYITPSDIVVVPFALVFVVLLARAVRPGPAVQTRDGVLLLIASVVAPLAKPSLTVVSLVAAPVYMVLARSVSSARIRLLSWSFVLPSVAVFVWQTWFLTSGASTIGSTSFAIEPLATVRLVGLDRSGPLLLSGQLVVILGLWAAPRRFVREPVIALTVLCNVAAAAMMLLLRETGERAGDATFTKPALMCAALLQIVSWRFLAGETLHVTRDGGRRRPAWVWAAAVLLALQLAAGAFALLDAAGVNPLPPRSTVTSAAASPTDRFATVRSDAAR